MKRIILVLYISTLYSCALYIEDLQKVYVERDGIYQLSKNQKTLEGDVFYSSFFNFQLMKIENISDMDNFTSLEKDTIYDSYLANNYFSDNENKELQEYYNKNKIKDTSVVEENLKPEIKYIDRQYKSPKDNYIYNNFTPVEYYYNDNYYYINKRTRYNNSNGYNSKKYDVQRVRKGNKKSTSNSNKVYRVRDSRRNDNYDSFKRKNPTNNKVKSRRDYNRRATNRRRR